MASKVFGRNDRSPAMKQYKLVDRKKLNKRKKVARHLAKSKAHAEKRKGLGFDRCEYDRQAERWIAENG